MSTVPPEWRGRNPWGPEAYVARAEGKLRPVFYTQTMAEWAEFGRKHIQDGDILFRYGKSYKPYEIFTSRVIAGIEDDRFSHNGIAHWEGDALYVYDAEPAPQGIRKVPFEFWVLDDADESLVIKRPRPEFRDAIPQAIAYCEDVWRRQVPFDPDLTGDENKLYCTEMIERAYRSAGIVLSEPVPIRCMPHYKRWLAVAPWPMRSRRSGSMFRCTPSATDTTARSARRCWKRCTNRVRTGVRIGGSRRFAEATPPVRRSRRTRLPSLPRGLIRQTPFFIPKFGGRITGAWRRPLGGSACRKWNCWTS